MHSPGSAWAEQKSPRKSISHSKPNTYLENRAMQVRRRVQICYYSSSTRSKEVVRRLCWMEFLQHGQQLPTQTQLTGRTSAT